MQIEILPDPDAVARRGAAIIAAEARDAVAARGRFAVAVSGGTTPWVMLRALAKEDLPWERVVIAQVDERVAPDGDPDRNFFHLTASLAGVRGLSPAQILAMPVNKPNLEEAARMYVATLEAAVGAPPVFDLVHLGLGTDGHTASLVPGDTVLDVLDQEVAATGVYQGRRRLTLTYGPINRARRVLWLVTGANKAEMLARLRDGDRSIPGGRVNSERALLLADVPAAARLT